MKFNHLKKIDHGDVNYIKKEIMQTNNCDIHVTF